MSGPILHEPGHQPEQAETVAPGQYGGNGAASSSCPSVRHPPRDIRSGSEPLHPGRVIETEPHRHVTGVDLSERRPAPQQWMERPSGITGCPPGLEYLTQINQLLVHQQVELLEVMTGWETCNKYQVKNSVGQQVYFAMEESDMCMRQCCGPSRGFVIHITDNNQQEVVRVTREFKCCAGCCWCANSDGCAWIITVEAPVGNVIGYVRQLQSCLEPSYAIMDANHETVLQIRGPTCLCQAVCCTRDEEFKVYTADMNSEVGKISKQWSGLVKEMFTNADNFGVTFPLDLDVKMKAVMLAAVFLIDFMFFEEQQNNNNN